MSLAECILRALRACEKCGARSMQGLIFCENCLNRNCDCTCPYCGAAAESHCQHQLAQRSSFTKKEWPAVWHRVGYPRLTSQREKRVWVPTLAPRHWEEASLRLPRELLPESELPLPLQPLESPFGYSDILRVLEDRGDVIRSTTGYYKQPFASWSRDPEATFREVREISESVRKLCAQAEKLAGGKRSARPPEPGWTWFWLPALDNATWGSP